MTIRKTSIEAYKRIKDEGLLSQRRWQVYDLLYKHGPMTGSQLAIEFKTKYGSLAPNAGNMVTRLGELRDAGAAEELGTRICPITSHRAIIWDVTGKLPKKTTKPTKIKCKHCNGKGYVLQEKLI